MKNKIYSAREFIRSQSEKLTIDSVVFGAILLNIGLIGFVPVFSLAVEALKIPLPQPTLIGVGLVGFGYAGYIAVANSPLRGSIAALVVTGTFGANIPLTGGAGGYPGTLGPHIWLVYFPLVLTAVQLLWTDARSFRPLSNVDLGLGILVVWSIVPVVVKNAADSEVAILYAVFWLINSLVVFWVLKTATYRGVVNLRSLATALSVTVSGHAIWALVQVSNGNSFRLSTLGEGRAVWATPVASFGPLGTRSVGAFVSGFTGGSLPFITLTTLAGPILLALAVRRTGHQRWFALIGFLLVTGATRAANKMSGLGGFVVGLVMFLVLLIFLEVWYDVQASVRHRLGNGATVVLSTLLLLYPVKRAKKLQNPETNGESSPGRMSKPDGSGQVQSVGGIDLGNPDPTPIPDWLPGSIEPNSTLGIRIQQYVASVDLWIRHPLTGIGGGNFRNYSLVYQIPIPPGHSGPLSLHNLYLAMLVETGIPGLLAFLTAILAVLYHGLTSLLSETSDRILIAGLLASMIGFLSLAFWDTVHLQITSLVPFWILAGGLVGSRLRSVHKN